MTTNFQFRDFAVAKAGYRYDTTNPYRLTGQFGYFDCSGLVFYAATQSGLNIPQTSWEQARWCRDNGLLLGSFAEAMATPGNLVFEGPNFGYDGFGADGHVAITIGDGQNIIEAQGHVRGVLVDSGINRGFVNWGRVKGLDYITSSLPEVIKVHPDYGTAIPIVSQVVFHHPSKGYASVAISADGAAYCYPPDAYLGGANGQQYFKGRTAAAVRATINGYVIWDTLGEKYTYIDK